MPTQTTNQLSWRQQNSRLYLDVGDRRCELPALITQLLLGDGGHGLTDDPAIDLLRLEQDLRRYAADIAGHAADVAEEVSYGSDAITLASAEGGLIGCWQRRKAFEHFAVAAAAYLTLTSRHCCARSWTSQFVSDNTNRADPAWWAYRSDTPGGMSYGDHWRRDGDDDDHIAAPLPRSGPWRLAHLSWTGEVYAVRRTGRQPEEVWLLGSEIHDDAEVMGVLTDLRGRMREPNSLILAAQTIHSLG